MQLLPIQQTLEANPFFARHPDCQDSLYMTFEFYKKVGFQPPWISYYAEKDGQLVGACAFKGAPVNGRVEIAYGTFPSYQHGGVATEMCRMLVALSLETDPTVQITARTLPENNFSTRVLKKNGFVFGGTVHDEEDGEVWEWVKHIGILNT